MEGPVRRRRGLGSRLALVTSLFMISSLFVIVGAQVASAAQCGQIVDPPQLCSLAFRFDGADSSPHRAAVGETITSVDLDPSDPIGFPVIVEVEDESHVRDTSYGGQISVALTSGSGKLSGTMTVTAVEGAARFTDLSIDTKGKDFQLTATATAAPGTVITPVTSGTFRIEGDRCARGETCTDSLPVGTTTLSPAPSQTLMVASLSYGGTGVVALSVGIDSLTSCSTDTFTDPFFHAPAETTVDEVRATGTGTKVVVLRIDKTWRQMVRDRGTQSYRACITAPVSFLTWPGNSDQSQNSPLIFNPATGEYTGLAPDCSMTITYFCRAFVKSNKSGDVLEGITFPAGGDQPDPRGH